MKQPKKKPPATAKETRTSRGFFSMTPLAFYALIGKVWADGFIEGVESSLTPKRKARKK